MRVAAIPAGHPYVQAVCDPAVVELLPDVLHAGVPATQWWPPRMLDADWITAHAADFDVLHLHFGMESYSVNHVAAALAAARAAGRPVVFTLHDLENPQLRDQSEHIKMLDLIVPAADELITLTPTAQREIAQRWGREARVVPHPALASSLLPGQPSAVRTVGLHLRDLRPNIDATGVVATLVRAVAVLRGAEADMRGVVYLNDDVRDDETAELITEMLPATGGVELRRTARMADDELTASIADLDASILPYSHGTHSGWLELCHDLAVPVIGPRVGHFGSQHPDDYTAFDIGDPVSLAAAILQATDAASSRPGSAARAAAIAERVGQRRVEGAKIRAAHTMLYRELSTPRLAA